MKSLIVALITIIPFIGLSQDIDKGINSIHPIYIQPSTKPDTLSAYLLVTTRHMGIAYQKRGFVVQQFGREPYFLDCEKRVIKQPFYVWQYRLINQTK